MLAFVLELLLEQAFNLVNPDEVTAYCTSNTALYPVMAVYTRGKPVQIAPTIIQRIQGLWTSRIGSASRVVTIGVYPHPADKHIWEPLSATKAKLLFVGDKRAFSEWQSKYRVNGESVYLGGHFGSCIRTIVETL